MGVLGPFLWPLQSGGSGVVFTCVTAALSFSWMIHYGKAIPEGTAPTPDDE